MIPQIKSLSRFLPQQLSRRLNQPSLKIFPHYKGYSFKFISISKDAKNLRTKTFSNPHNLIFSPAEDIFDIPSLLKIITAMDIDRQKEVYEFLKKELKSEPDPEKVESNLTTIIKILSKEDWSQGALGFETIPYDIEAKISYNQLDTARVLIDDYKIHYPRIDKIYSDFDKQGVNKSLSILNGIRTEYLSSWTQLVLLTSVFFRLSKKLFRRFGRVPITRLCPKKNLRYAFRFLLLMLSFDAKYSKILLGNTNAHS